MSKVFFNMWYTLYPVKVGTETIDFQIVQRKIVNGYAGLYQTTRENLTVSIEVMCLHNFGEGVITQEGNDFQSIIAQYTCSACSEKKTDETPPVFGHPDFILQEDELTIKESAFEDAKMSIVYVPDGCTFIEAHAFGNCTNSTKICLPKDCAIDANLISSI